MGWERTPSFKANTVRQRISIAVHWPYSRALVKGVAKHPRYAVLGPCTPFAKTLELATKHFAEARSTSAAITDLNGEVMALGCLMGGCLQQGDLAGLRSYCVDALNIFGQTRWSRGEVDAAS